MGWRQSALLHWLGYRLGRVPASTQLTEGERAALRRHASGRSTIVEIGVMHGASTALLRSVIAADGTVHGIDPHPRGRLGVSFERLTAKRELSKVDRGAAVLVRMMSFEAARTWTRPIDFLFIDGDHSWKGIERDWHDWSSKVAPGGLVALHDSRSVPGRPDLDSVRFTEDVILKDGRYEAIDAVDSLTVLRRVAESSTR